MKTITAAACAAAIIITAAGCGNENKPKESTDMTESTTAPTVTEAPVPEVTGAAAEYEWGNVEIVGGGYVTGIIFNPGEEGLVYAKTDVGGLYRRDKNNERWKPLTDRFGQADSSYYGIDGVAVDAKSPNKVYALAGMYGSMKAAVLCSDNYGDTWKITPLSFTAGGNEPHRQANRLELDPNDSKTLYAGARTDGLWVSRDSGASFTQVTSFPTYGQKYSEDGYYFGITAIAFDPSSSADGEPCKDIYVGTGDRTVYMSKDAGETWTEIAGAPADILVNHIHVIDGKVYFVSNRNASPWQANGGRIDRYDPKTGEWKDITPVGAVGMGDIEADPTDNNILYASTMGRYSGDEDDTIFRSTDGGESWESIFDFGDKNKKLYSLDWSAAPWLDWGKDHALLGWAIGDIAIDPFDPDEIAYGTGATVYHSLNLTDWGKDTIKFEVWCEGIEETVINDLCAANSDEIRLYSAMWDLDGFTHRSVDTAPSHMNANGLMTKCNYITCSYGAPEVAVRSGDADSAIAYTTDGGESWKQLKKPEGMKGDSGTAAVNCDGTLIYWTSKTATAVYRTSDFGKTWEKCDRTFASCKIAADCFDPDTLYVYTSMGMYVSSARGDSFEKLDSFIPDGCSIYPSPEKEGDCWLYTSMGGLYLVSDRCSSIERKNIASAKAFCIGAAKDGNSPMTLYAIGENDGITGVWRSLDSGDTWERINDDMHQFGNICGPYGRAMAADQRTYGQIYFGTNGRGIIMGRIKK